MKASFKSSRVRGERQAEDVTMDEIQLIMHALATGESDDIVRLRELDILNKDPDADISFAEIMQESWRTVSNYKAPKSVKEARSRPDGEGEAWWDECCKELDWFIVNGKVEILHKDTLVPPSEIPPYAWNKDTLGKLRLVDLGHVQELCDKQDKQRKAGGGTIDECFDILSWMWMFTRKMSPPPQNEDGTPSDKQQCFKKCRARCCLMGCDQVPLHTYDPLRVSAAVVHPASFHLVNILIVNFGMHIFKIDDPKAFCKGDADYPIYSYAPRGVESVKDYAPFGRNTRWKILGAIYGLIQASLRYFLKAADVMEGLGFIQCPFDKTVFIKWFNSQSRFLLFWQHVDDRFGGVQQEEDLHWFLTALTEQLQSMQEPTTELLGLDCEYNRVKGIMRLRATTKIMAFIKREHLENVRPHDTPMSIQISKTMTRAHCPVTAEEIKAARQISKQYRTYSGFFGFCTNTVFVIGKNVARLLSRFLANPGVAHHKAVMYAIGWLYKNCNEYMEYKRSKNFDGSFRLFTMVDADLGGDSTRGPHGNSVMAGVIYLNESHCYSYSKTIKAVCLHTHHTEYYALTEGSQMTIYVASVLRSLRFKLHFPLPVVGDNQSALATASVPSTKAGRHINLREHWIRDVLEHGDLVIGFIPGPKNAANLNTKILGPVQFQLEAPWQMRGIHSDGYQMEIIVTIQEIWMRMFTWEREQAAKREKATAKAAEQKGKEEA